MIDMAIFLGPMLLGAFLVWRSKRGRWKYRTGIALVILPALLGLNLGYGSLIMSEVDSATGWSLELNVENNDYRVSLVHSPGPDFYETMIRIEREDGAIATEYVGMDDFRWWFGRTKREGSRDYFVTGLGRIGESTPYFDFEKGEICGYNRKWPKKISSMEFTKP